MKKILTLFLCWFVSNSIAQEFEKPSFTVPMIGNSFEIGYTSGHNSVGRKVVHLTPDKKNKTSTFFNVLRSGDIKIQLIARVLNNNAGFVHVGFGKKKKKIKIESTEFSTVDVGVFDIPKEGYYSIDFLSTSTDVEIQSLHVSGTSTQEGMIYCGDPEFYYWARRGPSCHLAYSFPTTKDVTYYYNEVTVPKGSDVNGSYFMANGFAEGYFGMQVNSDTERRILFSVWSPFTTDDPKSIPDDHKILLLKKGKDVHVGEFGNEGSGGQSYLRYNWKAGETYKFLLKGNPDGNGNTDYTAWIFTPENNTWNLIASFKRPHTNTYLKTFHSFLENFNPNQGYISREVDFQNQWVFDGQWNKVTAARLTVDNTYHKKQRIDATGGQQSNGYFLKMGGFFSEVEKPNTIFKFDNNRTEPQVDFSKLP